jgi:hypothetical protein
VADKCDHGTPLGEDCDECRAIIDRSKRTDPSDIQRLRDIGNSAPGCLTTETGIVWHPANELLGAAKEIERLRSALQMIADETLCPDLWRPQGRRHWSDSELAHRTALVIARAALEPAHAK